NRVLPNIDIVEAEQPSDDALRPLIRGQLLALRALAHFELLQWYAKRYDPADPLGVPVMLKADLLGKPARNSVAEVVAQIEDDLNTAKGLAANAAPGNFNDLALNKISIAAIEARVAL